MSDELPQGWIEAPLPGVAAINMGQSPPSTTYNTNGDGLPFFQGKAEFGDLYPTAHKFCSRPNKTADANDIVMSVRAPVGPTNLLRERSCIGRGLAAIRPHDGIPSKYLLFYFRSIEEWLSTQGTGSTFTAISKSDLEQLPVRLAPLNEQRRIVAKLEQLLGKVDACHLRLAKIPVLFKRFRQSVLAAACSGRLTADWGEKNVNIESAQGFFEKVNKQRQEVWKKKANIRRRRTYPTPEDFDSANLPDTPESWLWVSADAICSQITDGEHIQPPYQTEGYLMLSAKHVRDGFVTVEDAGLISERDFKKALERCEPVNGDILIVSVGATTGRAAIVKDCPRFAIVRSVLLLKPLISAQFLLRCLQSPWCFRWMTKASGASAQPHLYIKDTKRLPVPFPPLVEQREIVRRVEALFALAYQIEARYAKAKAHVEKLTQSILAKAFRGELVPQDPNDEPVSELLKRIKMRNVSTKR